MSTAPCQQSAYTHAVQHKHSTEGHRIQFAGQAHHQILPCQEKDILFPLLLPSHLQHGCWPWCSLEVLLNQFIQLQLQITIFFPSFFFFCSGYILVSSSIMLAVRQAAVGASDPSAWLGVRQRRNEGCQQDSPPLPPPPPNSELLCLLTQFWETAPAVGKAVLSWGLTSVQRCQTQLSKTQLRPKNQRQCFMNQ